MSWCSLIVHWHHVKYQDLTNVTDGHRGRAGHGQDGGVEQNMNGSNKCTLHLAEAQGRVQQHWNSGKTNLIEWNKDLLVGNKTPRGTKFWIKISEYETLYCYNLNSWDKLVPIPRIYFSQKFINSYCALFIIYDFIPKPTIWCI